MKQYVLTDKKAARRLMRALNAPTERDRQMLTLFQASSTQSTYHERLSERARYEALNKLPCTVRLAANTVITDGGDAYCNRAIHRCHVDMDIISVIDLDSEQTNLYRVSTYGPLVAANEK